jgi:dCTP deaminase
VILSDADLKVAQSLYRLIAPFRKEHMQPASIDLTLGADFVSEDQRIIVDGGYELAPREFALGTTVEFVNVPPHLVAQINGRSSWARRGLIVHTTAGFIDPGFNGQITLELYNVGSKTLFLPVGERICQIVFTELTSPAERPYGYEGLGSHYQGQTGATPSSDNR